MYLVYAGTNLRSMTGFNEWPRGAGLSLSLGYEPNFKQSLFVCKHVTCAYKTPVGVTAVRIIRDLRCQKLFRILGFSTTSIKPLP